MLSSPDFYPSVFSPRPYNRSQRTMFSLGCSCGRAESQTPLSQRQTDCFSYTVSVDGVHVCYPHNVVKYESIEEEEPRSDPQNLVELVENESTSTAREDDFESNPQNLIEYQTTNTTREDELEDNSDLPVEYETLNTTGEDELESNPQTLVEYKSTEAAASEGRYPCSLLERRGRSLSGMNLALSIATRSTTVHLSGQQASERNLVDHSHPKSGNYDFIKQIGIDGEGVIHLMRSRSTKELIVRKTVSYARSAYGKPIEAAILQDLFPEGHNNIIRLHAFDSYQSFDLSEQVEGARYFLEYCSGGDLHQLVDQYRKHELLLPEPFIWQAYQQLASALEFLHRGFDPRCSDADRRGICHRDIKPSNVFLRFTRDSAYPDIVLADFGHATLEFATYDPAGTVFWQPPELPRHAPRGDVYSVGAVIHFLIHFQGPIAKLPDGLPDSESVKDAWAAAPEARKPIMNFVAEYSEELVCAMLVPLEADENKRKNSSQLLKFVSDCIEMKFPRGKAEEWPLAEWAFDHMKTVDGWVEVEEEDEDEEMGAEQYFDMMEVFGCGMSTREASRCASSGEEYWM